MILNKIYINQILFMVCLSTTQNVRDIIICKFMVVFKLYLILVSH